MERIRFVLLMVVLFILPYTAISGPVWTVYNSFSQKYFVENKGQFSIKDKVSSKEILYSARIDGVHYYFTKNGYYIQRYKKVRNSEKEIRELKKRFKIDESDKDAEEKQLLYKMISDVHEVKLENSNDSPKIIAIDPTETVFNFPDLDHLKENVTISAQGFAKIIYKDVYPGIDMIYEFPKNASGIKYSFEVRPGANTSLIKLSYGSAVPLINTSGNLEIASPIGKVTEHKPVSYFKATGVKVESRFIIHRDKAGFELSQKKFTETVIIDPWVVTPAFTGVSKAYDVEYDKYGNTYVLGGGYPNQIIKYSANGFQLWIYSLSQFGLSYHDYGDFSVDVKNLSIYAVEGINMNGSQVVKLDRNGLQTAYYPGDPKFTEMWRIAFSQCTNNAVIAGGGIVAPSSHTCYLDSNLANLTPVNNMGISSTNHDFGLLALDNFGAAYVCSFKSLQDNIYNNYLFKLPLPALNPPVYAVPNGYGFLEVGSLFYVDNSSSLEVPNGYNGIVTSNTRVYTYDSYTLKRWDGGTGSLISLLRVNIPANGDTSSIYWGGIAADDCDNVLLADSMKVRLYDASLNLVNSYTMPGMIYDIRLGSGGDLYVCGNGFVSKIKVVLPNCSFSTMNATSTVSPAGCNVPGSAVVTVSGGTGPYTFSWNSNPPMFNDTVNLPPGDYVVTVVDNSCIPQLMTDTITIPAGPGSYTSVSAISPITCENQTNGAISVTNTGGTTPYTYSWSTGAAGVGLNAINNLAAGTYSVQINDNNGCINEFTYVISNPNPITYTVDGGFACANDTTTLILTASGGTGDYVYSWAQGATGPVLHGASLGLFEGTITDSAGCVKAFSFQPTAPPAIVATDSTVSYNCSFSNSAIVSYTIDGGAGTLTYNWSNGVSGSTTNSFLAPGSYTLTVTDANGCQETFTSIVPQYSPLVLESSVVRPCNSGSNGSATVNVSGGVSSEPVVYSWVSYPVNTNSLSGLPEGSYQVNVTNGQCIDSIRFGIQQEPIIDSLKMKGNNCSGSDQLFLSVPAGVEQPYQWYSAGTLIPNATEAIFEGQIGEINGYTVTYFLNGCRYQSSAKEMIYIPDFTAGTNPNVFTPNNDSRNDIYFPFDVPNDWLSFGRSFSMDIYNRWGIKVFETTGFDKGWDGKNIDGKELDAGVYYWVARIETTCTTEPVVNKGFVHLLR